ncbi:MAG: DUF445 family protein [Gammaproteobacteria bacterium]|nr:DUF445 family protein [Gammaproteobacteria bacterium]
MAPELIASRLQTLRLGERAARWPTVPANAERVSRTVAQGLAGAVRLLRDEDVQSLIDQALITRLRNTKVAPLLGGVLALLTANGRHQELLDYTVSRWMS